MHIAPLSDTPDVIDSLSDILIEVVAGGGSVSFMHPLSRANARAFWQDSLAAAANGKRIVLGAWEGKRLTGTLTLLLDCPPNQPHRAELAKMMTRPDYRGCGIASALAREAEQMAIAHGKTLLVLDTASDGGASGLYEGLGFIYAGEIPDYALKPHGGLTGTRLYWKRLTPAGPLYTMPGTA
jgi:ribosomal protein S18 acetylase RimI-like enzyme